MSNSSAQSHSLSTTSERGNVSPSSSSSSNTSDNSFSSTRTTSTIGSSVCRAFTDTGLDDAVKPDHARKVRQKRIEDVVRERRKRDMEEEADHRRRETHIVNLRSDLILPTPSARPAIQSYVGETAPQKVKPVSEKGVNVKVKEIIGFPGRPTPSRPESQQRKTIPQARATGDFSKKVDVQIEVEEVVNLSNDHRPSRFEIRPIAGKGRGLIATTNIGQGEIIVREAPFLIVDHPPSAKQISNRVSALSVTDCQLVHTFVPSLGKRYTSRLVDIIATNVIPLGGDPLIPVDDDIIPLDQNGEPEHQHRSGLFKTICRVNHACLPNAQWTWLVATNKMILKALRPIPAGQEITACYLQDPALGYNDRQDYLKDIWGFDCHCETCKLPILSRIGRDQRFHRYRQLRDEYVGTENEETWEEEGLVVSSKAIKDAISLLDKDGPIEEIAECRASLYQLSVRWGDEGKAQREGKAWVRHCTKMGDELGPMIRQYVKKPRMAPGWGMFDDDRSGDESECDSADDFEKTQLQQFKRVRLGGSKMR